MSIEVTCRCGSRFMAPPHLAGKQVPCPKCRQGILIPKPQEPTITTRCSCGAAYRVKESMRGQRTQCKSCKQTFVIGADSAGLVPVEERPATPDLGGVGFGNETYGYSAASVQNFGLGNSAAYGNFQSNPMAYVPPHRPRSTKPILSAATVKRILIVVAILAGVSIGITVLVVVGSKAWEIAAGGYSTPEAAFDGLCDASRTKNYRKMLATLSPTSREKFVGMFAVIAAVNLRGMPDAEQLLKKHGIDANDFRQRHNIGEGMPFNSIYADENRLMLAGREIRNKAGFIEDLMASYEDLVTRRRGGLAVINPFSSLQHFVVTDIVYSGDRAIGIQKLANTNAMVAPGISRESKVAFHRVNGRWFIDISNRSEN